MTTLSSMFWMMLLNQLFIGISFLKEHAELLKVFEEAKNVLLVSDEAMEVMTLSEERKLKHRIFTTLEINNMDY